MTTPTTPPQPWDWSVIETEATRLIREESKAEPVYPYKRVGVLIVTWKTSDVTGMEEEAIRLGTLLKETYRFSAFEHFLVPDVDTQSKTETRLKEWIQKHSDPETLLLFYMGSHGGEWRGTLQLSGTVYGPSLCWESLKRCFGHSKSDVLILLCMCNAAGMLGLVDIGQVPETSNGETYGVIESIVATGLEASTVATGPTSFVTVLSHVLEQFAIEETPFSVICLQKRMLARILRLKHEGNQGELPTTPVYLHLRGSPLQRLINLRPLQSTVQPDMGGLSQLGATSNLGLSIWWGEQSNSLHTRTVAFMNGRVISERYLPPFQTSEAARKCALKRV